MRKSADVRLMGLGRLGLAMVFAGSLGACASLPKFHYAEDAPIDTTSPVAKDVIEADRHPGPYPRFSDIPKLPKDVRSEAAWNRAVKTAKASEAELNRETAQIAAAPVDTEAFAAEAKRGVAVEPAEVPTAKAQAESAAYAKSLRDRVKPPPKRH
jgi:hypothetical protein